MIATSSGGDHQCAKHYGGQMKRINIHNQKIHDPGPTGIFDWVRLLVGKKGCQQIDVGHPWMESVLYR